MANIFDDFSKQGTPNLVPFDSPPKNIFDNQNTTTKTNTIVGKKRDLQTLEGLQALAEEKGVGEEAQKISTEVRPGEKPKEIFSGGFISDIFDALSVGQYAVAGLAEGKTLKEAIDTRSSWTDPELLGRYGGVGTIAGVVADIFIDPVNLIPVLGFGEKALKSIKQGTKFLAETKVAKPVADALGRAFIYRFGQNPVYAKIAEDAFKAIAVGQEKALGISRPIAKLAASEQLKIGKYLKGEITTLDEKLLPLANQARNEFKKLGEEAVKVGLLDSDTYFSNINKYMPRLYEKYEMPPAFQKYLADIKPQRADLSRFMKREDIPEEIRKSMGEILTAGYPVGKGLAQMRQSVEMTKFFNEVAVKYGKDVAEEGMKKLPMAKRLFTTSQGEIISKYKQIQGLNEQLNPLLKQLESTFGADKNILAKIKNVQKAIGETRGVQLEEFSKFFQEGQTISKQIPQVRRLGTLPERLQLIANQTKQFKKIDELVKSNFGMELKKMDASGFLERAGFGSVKDFFNSVKSPYKFIPSKEVEVLAKGDLGKIIRSQREIENLSESLSKFTNIDKRSINDSLRFLEDTISSIRFKKGELVGDISALKLGTLAGKYVPEPIFRDIEEMIKTKSGFEKAVGKAVGTWKFGKVVLNPATHARNILSNFLLNDFEGLSPTRLDVYTKAAKSLLTKDETYREAKAMGLGLDTFAAQEIKDLLLPAKGIGQKIQAVADKISSIYQGEEEYAKMAQYIFQKSKGLSPEEAFKIAERATFNYAQVTPLIRKLRTSAFGFPFITFTYKATPQVAKTLITHPGKISKIGKIARGIESLSPQETLAEERAVEPDYIRDGYFVRLPNNDKLGRPGYFDLTYIIPFGDLVSGQFLTPRVDPETGQKEGILQTILRQQPLFNTVAEIAANKDFFGEPIVKPTSIEPEQQGLDLLQYIAKFYLPPSVMDFPMRLVQSAEFEKQAPEEQKMEELGIRQTKTVAQEAMRGLLGIKVQPINQQLQATMADKDKRKALESFLEAKGIIAQFKTPFVPKEK